MPRNKLYLNKALAFSFGSLRSLEEGDRNVCNKINVSGVCIDDAGCLRSYEYRKAERAGDPGTDYKSQLANKYKEIVNYEANKMVDYYDAGHFATKAMNVLDRKDTPGPEKLDDWYIKEPFKHDLTRASKWIGDSLENGRKGHTT